MSWNPPPFEAEYRKHVGPEKLYDIIAANQFIALINNGLREYHSLLDIGCGCLRAGRLFINYLLPERYYGIEPESQVLEAAIKNEIGLDQQMLKGISLNYNDRFDLHCFPRKYDYILAHSIFSHTSPQQINKCIKEASEVLRREGIFLATYIEGPDSNKKDWTYPSGVTYTFKTIKQLCNKYKLVCEKMKLKHPGNQTWIRMKHA